MGCELALEPDGRTPERRIVGAVAGHDRTRVGQSFPLILAEASVVDRGRAVAVARRERQREAAAQAEVDDPYPTGALWMALEPAPHGRQGRRTRGRECLVPDRACCETGTAGVRHEKGRQDDLTEHGALPQSHCGRRSLLRPATARPQEQGCRSGSGHPKSRSDRKRARWP